MSKHVKIHGMNKIHEALEHFKSPEFLEESFTKIICEKVPEAAAVKDNIRYIHRDGKFYLDPESISPELYKKISETMQVNS